MADCANISIDGTSYPCKDNVARRVVSKTYDGLCPQLPNENATTKFLRQDGTWVAPPNTTYSVVSKTANGLCPQLPNETTTTKYLRQDGTWVAPPNTTYSVVSTSADGLCPQLAGGTSKYLRADGTWVVPPNTTTGTTYNAGNVPANTTFGTNGSIKNVYDSISSSLGNIYHFLPINGSDSNLGRHITNAIEVSTTKRDDNTTGYILSTDSNVPSNLNWGIWECYYYDSTNIVIKITGRDSAGNPHIWLRSMVGTSWSSWKDL